MFLRSVAVRSRHNAELVAVPSGIHNISMMCSVISVEGMEGISSAGYLPSIDHFVYFKETPEEIYNMINGNVPFPEYPNKESDK